MSKWVAKIMLSICLWNVVGGTLPAAAAEFFADATQTVQKSDPCANGGNVADVHSEEESDCDPSNCENEQCRFHQCHFGHCNFVVSQANLQEVVRHFSVSVFWPEFSIESVSFNNLIRPPIA